MPQELHVTPERGGWLVSGTWFPTLGEAERAARETATAGVPIYLHDLYHRVHAVAG
jgi:hypothetical protein